MQQTDIDKKQITAAVSLQFEMPRFSFVEKQLNFYDIQIGKYMYCFY